MSSIIIFWTWRALTKYLLGNYIFPILSQYQEFWPVISDIKLKGELHSKIIPKGGLKNNILSFGSNFRGESLSTSDFLTQSVTHSVTQLPFSQTSYNISLSLPSSFILLLTVLFIPIILLCTILFYAILLYKILS